MLPIEDIAFLMGNDIAGGKVTPVLEVLDTPQRKEDGNADLTPPNLFPACVVTRAQARKSDDVPLSDTVLIPFFLKESEGENEADIITASPPERAAELVGAAIPDISLPVSRDRLCTAQKADPTLRKCFSGVVSANNNASSEKVAYFLDKDILMRKWCSSVETDLDWSAIYQRFVFSAREPVVRTFRCDKNLSAYSQTLLLARAKS